MEIPIIVCRICEEKGPAGFCVEHIVTKEMRGLCQLCVEKILYAVHCATEHPGRDCEKGEEEDNPFGDTDGKDTANAIRRWLELRR